MNKNLFWGTVIALAFASCTQEDALNNEYGLKTLEVSVEKGVESRVGFTDAAQAEFFWTKGDKIGVTTTSSTTTFQGMTLVGEGGEATGTFTGNFSGTATGYAVYPYGNSERHSVSNDNLTYVLPSEYTYTTLDAEYAKVDGNSHNAPMWGKIGNGAVTFKHLGGVIAFSVNNLPENTSGLKFVLSATNQISGSFNATLTETEPMIVTSTDGVQDADKKVTITFTTGEGQTSGYFYVPVPTGALGNLRLKIMNGETEVATGAWDNISISRKDIRRANIGSQSIIGGNGEIKQVTSVNDVNNALNTEEETLTVQVSEMVQGENIITIPDELETTTTTLSFTSCANDAAIKIGEETSGDYAGKIIIEIPVDATLPSVEASIPNGEVYIKQGNVTTLVVSSADNTTIIGAGATIGTLTVVKGNVRIEDGGSVTSIVRSENHVEPDAKTYVIYEGSLPTTPNENPNIIYISAVEWDLRKAIVAGKTEVTLDANIDLTSSLEVSSDLVVNLNGKEIKCASSDVFVVTDGTLTINGNGLVYGSYDNSSSSCAVWAKENGKVVINGGTYKVGHDGASMDKGSKNWRNDCIYARDNAQITINGGEFEYTGEINTENFQSDGNRFLLNCRDDDYKAGTCSITVLGGTFHNFNPGATSSENPVANYLAVGYSSVKGENNTYVVKGGIYNEIALKAAIASGFKQVDLDANIDLTSSLEVSCDLVVNLNGKEIKCASSDVFVVTAGTLTINGEGIVWGSYDNSSSSCAVWAKGTGKAIINGGTYKVGHDGASKTAGSANWRNDCIYARDNAQITINGGEFEYTGEINTENFQSDGNRFLLNCRDDDYKAGKCSITVMGGTFHNFNPGSTSSENPVANYVAVGYSSVAGENNTYIVEITK